MKKLNIYFYSPGFTNKRPVEEFADRTKTLFLNPTPLYLHSYIKRNEPDLLDKFEFTRLQYLPLTTEELIADIEKYDIDVLALSVYTWNNVHVMNNIKGIHDKLAKPVKIIIGGPNVMITRDEEYLVDHPEIEFAIYAQGESPFISVLKHYLGIEKISLLKSKNIAWMDQGKLKKADYEFNKITNGSPVVESRHLLEQVVNDPYYKDWILHFPYETSRGCPYNCSFCDWTSGLSHKVSKRKFAYEEELETLGQLGITDLYMADANFGLFPEDLGIAETMARLKKEKGYNFWIHGNNFSKTKKDQVFKIADIFVGAKITPYIKFSIQDINEEVLNNIDRPDIAWSEHIKYILKLKEKYPETVMALDIIKGLPGQTRVTWETIFNEICQYNIQLDVYDWEIIANSPAGYDKDYQKRMELKTMIRYDGEHKQEDVIETLSYTIRDYAYFTLLYGVYSGFFRNHTPAFPKFLTLVKNSARLDEFVDAIVEDIKDKKKIKQIVQDAALTVIKEHISLFNKKFVEKVLKDDKKFGNNGMHLIHKVLRSPKELIKEVFKE